MDTEQFNNLLMGWATIEDAKVSTAQALVLFRKINKFFEDDREAATQAYFTWKLLHPEMKLW